MSVDARASALRSACEVSPSNAFTAHYLQSSGLTSATDFDDGIRSPQRGLRIAAATYKATFAIQDEALATHDQTSRMDGGPSSRVPPHATDALGADWELYPHSLWRNLQHVRGSFPVATKTVGTIGQSRSQD